MNDYVRNVRKYVWGWVFGGKADWPSCHMSTRGTYTTGGGLNRMWAQH